MGAPPTSDQLMLFAAASHSHAKTSALPEKARALKALAQAYGASTPELLARYDPATSSWRMLRPCLFGEWDEFSGIYPQSGMTRNGELFRLPTSEPPISGSASGLLPTPSAVTYGTNQGGGMGRVGPVRPSLETMARHAMWQTPVSDDAVQRMGGKYNSRGEPKLSAPVMWPTPGGSRPHDTNELSGRLANQIGGSLNPTFVEFLMGYPRDFTKVD